MKKIFFVGFAIGFFMFGLFLLSGPVPVHASSIYHLEAIPTALNPGYSGFSLNWQEGAGGNQLFELGELVGFSGVTAPPTVDGWLHFDSIKEVPHITGISSSSGASPLLSIWEFMPTSFWNPDLPAGYWTYTSTASTASTAVGWLWDGIPGARFPQWVLDGGTIGLIAGALIPPQIDNPAVPEPSTMLLLGFGLVGLAGIARKKMKK